MHKTRILTDGDPRTNLLKGAETLYKMVSTTMGPRGNNVIFRKLGNKTAVTHDGVTVAKVVKIDDPAQDIGADLLREAAIKLDATTGDGTTTVTVLAYHMLRKAVELIEAGASPMKLRLELDEEVQKLVADIKDLGKKDVTEEDIVAAATVAAGDKTIGEEVGKLIYQAGKDTPIVLDFSQNETTYSEVINGFKIDSGPASPYLLEGAGLHLEITDPKVIVVDAILNAKDDILPILKTISTLPPEERKFLLLCEEVSGDSLSLLVVNRLKGFAEIAVARVPASINSKSQYLQDVAIATGAKVLSRSTGHTIMEPSPEDFGSAQKVIVEQDNTVIVNGHADPKTLAAHIKDLEASKTKAPAVAQLAKDRLLSLEQKVVSIRVGGQSETDAEERHYRYEDAVGASRAALRQGVIAGGGTVLYWFGTRSKNPILAEALKAPLEKVMENAGLDVPHGITPGRGIDVLHPELGLDGVQKGNIVDPVQSEVESVLTAATIAGLLMTSGGMIVEEQIKDETPELPRFS